MEKTMRITVTCKDEATKAKYEELAAKMMEDSEFKAALNNCASERDVYELYSSKGYTDLDYEDFCKEFQGQLESLVNVQGTNCELTEDELETVVGGFSFKEFFTTAISFVPVAGPLIQGIAKGIEAVANGEGAAGFVKHFAVGFGVSAFETMAIVATGGAATPYVGVVGGMVSTALQNVI